jgi:hypothetical protein
MTSKGRGPAKDLFILEMVIHPKIRSLINHYKIALLIHQGDRIRKAAMAARSNR